MWAQNPTTLDWCLRRKPAMDAKASELLLKSSTFAVNSKIYALIVLTITLFGLFGNANIIIATYRSSILRHKCNYLIAFQAVVDFFSGIGFIQWNLPILLFSDPSVNSAKCFYATSWASFLVIYGWFVVWLVGLDRYFAVKFPVR